MRTPSRATKRPHAAQRHGGSPQAPAPTPFWKKCRDHNRQCRRKGGRPPYPRLGRTRTRYPQKHSRQILMPEPSQKEHFMSAGPQRGCGYRALGVQAGGRQVTALPIGQTYAQLSVVNCPFVLGRTTNLGVASTRQVQLLSAHMDSSRSQLSFCPWVENSILRPNSVNSPVPGDGGSVSSTAFRVTFVRRERLLPWRLEGERADAKSPATRRYRAAPPSKIRRSRMPMRCIGPDL